MDKFEKYLLATGLLLILIISIIGFTDSATSDLQYKVESSAPWKPEVQYYDTYKEAKIQYEKMANERTYSQIIDQRSGQKIAYTNKFTSK